MPRPTQNSSSQLPTQRATRRTHSARLHETASQRPTHYEVLHRPRHVTPSHLGTATAAQPANERKHADDRKPPAKAQLPRALKRLRRVRFGPWEWIGLGASLAACLLLLRGIAGAQSEQHRLRTLVSAKQAQLTALNQQKNEEAKKLAYMRSEKGREQVLAERGYLKPGDRILVFPAANKNQQ